ncbi:hypothetical protein ACH4YO_31430 [Streptomyces noursei]|uniref:hypothetical protein n=1 Tax=Streptomyces noursei TaxID=1971 RepID=UPI0033CBCA77
MTDTATDAARRLVCTLDTTTDGVVHTGAAHEARPTALRLTVGNPGQETLRCERIVLSLPVGEGPDRLTTRLEPLRLAPPQPGWRLQHTGPDRIELLPDGGTEVPAGETRTLFLDGLVPHDSVGAVTLDSAVHWSAAGGRATGVATDAFALAKTDVPDLLKNFKPSRQNVGNGEEVEISWKGMPEKDRPVYRLYFGTTEIKADDSTYMDKDGNGKYTTPALTATTAFMMLVKYKGTDYGWTIAVTVSEPDLTVGELISNGIVQLWGKPATVLSTSGATAPFTETFEAKTDGMLAGRVDCEADGQAVDFSAVVTSGSPSVTHTTTACARRAAAPENVMVPVPKGATLSLSLRAESGSYGGQLTWFPMGKGELAEKQKS